MAKYHAREYPGEELRLAGASLVRQGGTTLLARIFHRQVRRVLRSRLPDFGLSGALLRGKTPRNCQESPPDPQLRTFPAVAYLISIFLELCFDRKTLRNCQESLPDPQLRSRKCDDIEARLRSRFPAGSLPDRYVP